MNPRQDDPVGTALGRFLPSFNPGPVGIETVGLSRCRGRVLANDVPAVIDSPPFSRALVEGFLVRAEDTDGAGEDTPVNLTISGMIEPGMTWDTPLSSGSCLEVSTGSFIPEGPYAVVRYVDTVRSTKEITVRRGYRRGENIEARGCEIRRGEIILRRGIRVTPREIMILAGQGITCLEVSKRPQVAIFCSGNEVIPPSESLRPGCIYDANSYSLAAQVEEYGGVPLFAGIMKDDLSLFRTALREMLERVDMVVISGGTAVGGKEFIVELIDSLGRPGVVVNGVPMRSGKPLIMGVIENKPVVCVAGYPPEAIRGFELFGRPVIERLLGIDRSEEIQTSPTGE